MVTYVKGDLLKSDCDYICHQVNCRGRMGSGIAKQIRDRFPEVYESYMELCNDDTLLPEDLLGSIDIVGTDSQYDVISIFGQLNYGYDGKRYTSYQAFRHALELIYEWDLPGSKIGFPKYIGCGLGGGDWSIVSALIEEILGDRYDVYIYELDD